MGILWSKDRHDAAIYAAAGQAVEPSLATVSFPLPTFPRLQKSRKPNDKAEDRPTKVPWWAWTTVRVSLPWFSDAHVESWYAQYALNDTTGYAFTGMVLAWLLTLTYAMSDILDSDPTNQHARVTSRLVLLAILLYAIVMEAAKPIAAPRFVTGHRLVLWCCITAAIHVRTEFEVTTAYFIRSQAAWSAAMKAAAVCMDVGFFRITAFLLFDAVASTVCEVVKPATPLTWVLRWEVTCVLWFSIVAYLQDIQHRRAFLAKCTIWRAKRFVTEAERMQRFLVNSMPDLVCVLSVDDDEAETGEIVFASDNSMPMLGLPPHTLIGKRLLDLVHNDDRAIAQKLLVMHLDCTVEHAQPAALLQPFRYSAMPQPRLFPADSDTHVVEMVDKLQLDAPHHPMDKVSTVITANPEDITIHDCNPVNKSGARSGTGALPSLLSSPRLRRFADRDAEDIDASNYRTPFSSSGLDDDFIKLPVRLRHADGSYVSVHVMTKMTLYGLVSVFRGASTELHLS